MIIVAYDIGDGQLKVDFYPAEDTWVHNREGFVQIKQGKEAKIIACYSPSRFIMARKLSPQEVLQMQGVPAAQGPLAQTQELTENADPLHNLNGAEGRAAGPDR